MMAAWIGFPFRPSVPIIARAPSTATETASTSTAVSMGNLVNPWLGESILTVGAQVTPLLRDPGDAQLPHTLLRGHPDRLGEGGERERQLGELLDPHVRGHAGGDH